MYNLTHTIPERKQRSVNEAQQQRTSRIIMGKYTDTPEQHLKIAQEMDSVKLKQEDIIHEQPLTVYEEPNYYNEIVTKFDTLTEKINELAKSSGDISGKESIMPVLSEFQNVIRYKQLENKTVEQLERKSTELEKQEPGPFLQVLHGYQNHCETCLHNEAKKSCDKVKNIEPSHKNISIPKGSESPTKLVEPHYLEYQTGKRISSQSESLIPPILNNEIPYKPVKSKECLKRYQYTSLQKSGNKIQDMKKTFFVQDRYLLEKPIPFEKVNSLTSNVNIQQQDYIGGPEIERFRILISGHITHKDFPVFIIHQNYLDLSILNKTPDFKCHKQEGNVDVFIKGNFFNENILIEDQDSPIALDFKSHKLLIGNESTILDEKFKNIFHLESADINLEGEFTMNAETFQYIPVFSLDILKHSDSNSQSSVTVMNCGVPTTTPFTKAGCSKENNQKGMKPHGSSQLCTKRAHYSNEKEISKQKNNTSDKWSRGLIEKLKANKIFRLIFKGKGRDYKGHSGSPNLGRTNQINGQGSNGEEEKILKNNSVEKLKKKTSQTSLQKEEKSSQFVALEIYSYDDTEDIITSTSPRQEHKCENTTGISVSPRRKSNKRKRKRSNIVENPMFVQMQELFMS